MRQNCFSQEFIFEDTILSKFNFLRKFVFADDELKHIFEKRTYYHTPIVSDLYIQFHWQFLITNFCFWLVNIMWRKYFIQKEKKMKMIKTQILWWKAKMKMLKKCSLFWTHPTDPSYSEPQTLEKQKI